jgi:hypothetical protein
MSFCEDEGGKKMARRLKAHHRFGVAAVLDAPVLGGPALAHGDAPEFCDGYKHAAAAQTRSLSPRAAHGPPSRHTIPKKSMIASRLFAVACAARANIVMEALPCEWVSVTDRDVTRRVMARHFGVVAKPTHACDVFTVRGVPAAAMLYDRSAAAAMLYDRSTTLPLVVVDEFHLKLDILLLFDAAGTMRRQLRARFVTRHAVHRHQFWSVP